MSTFIKNHLVEKIKSQVKIKQTFLGYDGFLYFDKKIDEDKIIIDRINDVYVYQEDYIMPLVWNTVKPQSLIKIYSELKDNNFYIYKSINSKFHKLRIKKTK